MGKASRRKGQQGTKRKPAPYAARPFAGLAREAQWVALREIVPAAEAQVTATVDGVEHEVTLATVLPLAWPALRRSDGVVMVAVQTGIDSGDASRDLAEAVVAAVALEPGKALEHAPVVTTDSPRLQDLITGAGPQPVLHDDFEFWMAPEDLDAGTRESLSRANEAIAPTVALATADAAYWVRIGDRAYVRWILDLDEDVATDALARLHAAGGSRLGADERYGRLLGAFRAYGLLVPVWEVDPGAEPASHEPALADLRGRLEDAAARTEALTDDERRARNGLVGRQLTLR